MRELEESLYIGENNGPYHIITEDINICSVEEKFEAYLTMIGHIYIWVFNLEYPLEQRYFLEYMEKVLIEIGAGSESNKVQSARKICLFC